jgi:hypothetical protein
VPSDKRVGHPNRRGSSAFLVAEEEPRRAALRQLVEGGKYKKEREREVLAEILELLAARGRAYIYFYIFSSSFFSGGKPAAEVRS